MGLVLILLWVMWCVGLGYGRKRNCVLLCFSIKYFTPDSRCLVPQLVELCSSPWAVASASGCHRWKGHSCFHVLWQMLVLQWHSFFLSQSSYRRHHKTLCVFQPLGKRGPVWAETCVHWQHKVKHRRVKASSRSSSCGKPSNSQGSTSDISQVQNHK